MSVTLSRPDKFKNVGFISTRIAGTDGVSLEIQKGAHVLERNGFNCFYFAGELDRDKNKSYLCAEAHFEHPDIEKINTSVFGVSRRSPEISALIQQLKDKIKQELYAFIIKNNIDLLNQIALLSEIYTIFLICYSCQVSKKDSVYHFWKQG